MMKITSLHLILFCCVSGAVLAVQYCSICAMGYCENNVPCIDEGVTNATGCVSFWVNYGSGMNLSYGSCWDPSLGSCEQIIEAEKQNGHDAVCTICYEDNCNFPDS